MEEPADEEERERVADAVAGEAEVVHEVAGVREELEREGSSQDLDGVVILALLDELPPHVQEQEAEEYLQDREGRGHLQCTHLIRGEVLVVPLVAVGECDLVLEVERAVAVASAALRVAVRRGEEEEARPLPSVRARQGSCSRHVYIGCEFQIKKTRNNQSAPDAAASFIIRQSLPDVEGGARDGDVPFVVELDLRRLVERGAVLPVHGVPGCDVHEGDIRRGLDALIQEPVVPVVDVESVVHADVLPVV